MWGSSFADLAKKAAELQEQAAHSLQDSSMASGFKSGAGGFFNMDSLQQQQEQQEEETKEQKQYRQQATTTTTTTPYPQTPTMTTSSPITTRPKVTVHRQPPPPQQQQQQTKQHTSPIIPEKTRGKLVVPTVKPLGTSTTPLKGPSLPPPTSLPNPAAPKSPTASVEEEQDSKPFVSPTTNGGVKKEEPIETASSSLSSSTPSETSDRNDATIVKPTEQPSQPESTTTTAKEPPSSSSAAAAAAAAASANVPDHVYQQFSQQLERLEENHREEQRTMQLQLDQLQQQHQQEKQAMEEKLSQGRLELQNQSKEWNRTKEGYVLQVEKLKKDLKGAKELLEDKGKEDRKLQEKHLHQLRGMEKQMNQKVDESKEHVQQVKDLQQALEDAKNEVTTSKDEYQALKERAKVVAGELKERRAQCRTLQSEVSMLTMNNQQLQDQITSLEAQGMDMNQSTKETQQALNELKGQLMDKEKELSLAQTANELETKKGEEALAAYKKRAQQSLAVANSRTASAVQAKEEAELEARAARTTADSAMARAMEAERKGKDALAEAKTYVTEMEQEVNKYNQVKDALEEATTELTKLKSETTAYQESNEKLKCELQSVQGRFEAEQKTTQDARASWSEAESRSLELYDEGERLRKENQKLKDELQRARAASSESKESDDNDTNQATANNNGGSRASMTSIVERHNAEAEATIAMLHQELQDANQAIKELKETLKSTVEGQDAPELSQTNGDGGMPLFYAMEKQAELTQARNEIARLATLVGDSESTKQEALDAMEEMKMDLETIQARLKRHEDASKRSPEQERLNLEYLKNVVLSFLNAKTPQEKKALLPVIGTVLCLTQEEQRQAVEHLEQSGHVLDSVQNSLLGKFF